jgi:N-dimethylarginine dimethylaminohydrolase
MTLVTAAEVTAPAGTVRSRGYVMCPPTHFGVSYRINPWMDPAAGANRARAVRQWARLREILAVGHDVTVLDATPGQPDMVFAANAAVPAGNAVLLARFRHPERAGEEPAYAEGFRRLGFSVVPASYVNEGQGDYLRAGPVMLGGSGFRTDPRAHDEVAEFTGLPVVPLELVDDRFYHLDTALAVLDEGLVAYWPGAFSARSRGALGDLFPDAVLASEDDAAGWGLNACSDGQRVVMSAPATRLAATFSERGLCPVMVDVSELQKAGGSVKCCVLELPC